MGRISFPAITVSLLCCSSLVAQTDLAARAQRGKQALAEERFAEAATIYAEIVAALPDDPGMRLNLGMALSMAGRVREAMPQLQRAVDLKPTLLAAWLFLGANWLELGEYARAASALRNVTAVDPDHVRARELLGRTLLAQKDYRAAAVEFGAVSERDRASAAAWFGLGRSYEALAREAFEVLDGSHPESEYVLALRADALATSRRLDAARELYERALKLRPQFGAARRGLAELDQRRDAGSDAPCQPLECEFLAGDLAAVVRRALGEPTPDARYWLTRAYNELARAAFGELARLPPSPELHQFRAELYTNQGRHPAAVEELQRALRIRPGDPALTKQLGACLYRAKSYEEAARVLERVAQRDSSPDVLFLLGDTLLTVGRSAEAVKVLERTVALVPRDLSARSSLGRAYLQQGQPAAAIPHLEAALAVDDDGSVHYQLARAYQATGNAERAKQMLEKYAALQKRSP